ncbi:hypothetical protein, partial [Mesorhizobium sp. M4B.F.Ca.ET.089.01.1.1]|uniref:hypothetical protein n=1 Tax=Mesorhizobium sp. M4B.F.Ca.ET.089.01.1.1 TaxID=2496662 RepID=UPI001AECF61C
NKKAHLNALSSVTGSRILRHDLFYGLHSGTHAQRPACKQTENFPQILGKFERIGFATDFT